MIYTSSTHTPLSSSFSLSLSLMGPFYWCPSTGLSRVVDVITIGPLLHYAWKCPTGGKMAYSQQRWIEGWIMDGEMEQQDTIAICFLLNWRFALSHTSEAQGQVTRCECELWSSNIWKYRRVFISVIFCVWKPTEILLSEEYPLAIFSQLIFIQPVILCFWTCSFSLKICVALNSNWCYVEVTQIVLEIVHVHSSPPQHFETEDVHDIRLTALITNCGRPSLDPEIREWAIQI